MWKLLEGTLWGDMIHVLSESGLLDRNPQSNMSFTFSLWSCVTLIIITMSAVYWISTEHVMSAMQALIWQKPPVTYPPEPSGRRYAHWSPIGRCLARMPKSGTVCGELGDLLWGRHGSLAAERHRDLTLRPQLFNFEPAIARLARSVPNPHQHSRRMRPRTPKHTHTQRETLFFSLHLTQCAHCWRRKRSTQNAAIAQLKLPDPLCESADLKWCLEWLKTAPLPKNTAWLKHDPLNDTGLAANKTHANS